MTLPSGQSAGRAAEPSARRLLRLAFLALLCALPFLVAIVYLERQVEYIDGLPADEYKDLHWAPDGRSLVLVHRPLEEGADSVVWSGDPSRTEEFTSLARLPADKVWRVTGNSVDGALVLGAAADGKERLAVLENATPRFLEPDEGWMLLPTMGPGLYFSKEVNDVPFEQMVDVEEAPEVAPEPETEPAQSETPAGPTRSGIRIARYNRSTGSLDVVLTIPFNGPREKPKVLMVRESPDQRFVALVTQFGGVGAAGLWVYDTEASRLLWTRVVANATVLGIDWSPSSVALALCDENGVAVLDNVLGIESTRYETPGLGDVTPLFAQEDSLYLVGASSLHRLDRKSGTAEVVFDSRSQGMDAISFVVDPSASRVAFFASPEGHMELLIYNLDNREEPPRHTSLPGSLRRQAQGTLAYQVGDALRTAWQFWKR
jgi:hypothetical protein